MRYLKKYNESSNILSDEIVNDLFLDLKDKGFNIDLYQYANRIDITLTKRKKDIIFQSGYSQDFFIINDDIIEALGFAKKYIESEIGLKFEVIMISEERIKRKLTQNPLIETSFVNISEIYNKDVYDINLRFIIPGLPDLFPKSK